MQILVKLITLVIFCVIIKLMNKKSGENGFITMIVVMVLIIVAVIAFAYMRVKAKNG